MQTTTLNDQMVSIEEIMQVTGYTRPYIKRIFAENGVTKLGKKDLYLKDETLAFLTCRSRIKAENAGAKGNRVLINERIRREWRKEVPCRKSNPTESKKR